MLMSGVEIRFVPYLVTNDITAKDPFALRDDL